MATYEIRRSGTVILRSSIVDCGYTGQTLKDMARAGLHLYCDGKKVKKAASGRSRTESSKGV